MLYLLGMSDEAAMAAIHQGSMERSWDEASFTRFLSDPTVIAYGYREKNHLMGFILGRHVLDESEILTLVVDPVYRRQAIGRKLLQYFCEQSGGAISRTVFLEVSAANKAARGLYTAEGFAENGVRKDYYATAKGPQDAIQMRKSLLR